MVIHLFTANCMKWSLILHLQKSLFELQQDTKKDPHQQQSDAFTVNALSHSGPKEALWICDCWKRVLSAAQIRSPLNVM